MDQFELEIYKELQAWQRKMERPASNLSFQQSVKGIQNRFNQMIPQRFQNLMTSSIRNMVQATLNGSQYTTKVPRIEAYTLYRRERLFDEALNQYKKTAAVEGAGTGAGGIFLGLVDFPLLLSIKMKFLFQGAAIYGHDIHDYRERLYLLYIFQLTYSSKAWQEKVYTRMKNWSTYVHTLPPRLDYTQEVDWEKLQIEYRDHLDLVKMLQMLPGVGAIVGAWANYHLLEQLGETARNSFRMRYFDKMPPLT
ncbi:EcsC family protein [Rubeoparvulum massiliense]|uniref:EcsC family protein n=1 Tax=Rubeoparvulum massiliense TaxID=1631346 RepID=UPI00065DF8FE|nr:EcsC family protein [Rubeoparvulum massiliense]